MTVDAETTARTMRWWIESGRTDEDTARVCAVSVQTVRRFRRKLGAPPAEPVGPYRPPPRPYQRRRPPVMWRAIVLIDEPEYVGTVQCVVPRCGVWTRTPTSEGTCPRPLWDDAHHEYVRGLG